MNSEAHTASFTLKLVFGASLTATQYRTYFSGKRPRKMDYRMLSRWSNMGRLDRVVRLSVGFVLVYFGLVTQTLTDSTFINVLAGLFGLTNIISSLLAICPAYLLANFSTDRHPEKTVSVASLQEEQHTAGSSKLPSNTTSVQNDSINRNLLISITLPVIIVLIVSTFLFLELANNYREKSNLAAATAIAEMALHIETTGEESLVDYRTEGVTAIIFHDAYGNIIPTILEKIPLNIDLASEILDRVAIVDQDQSSKPDGNQENTFTFEGQKIVKTTKSIIDRGLHVSVFYSIASNSSAAISPLLSRLAFAAFFGLWVTGWTAHYIIKRYTKYLEKNAEGIRYRSTHDLLTGLSNRTGLEEALVDHLTDAGEDQKFSVTTIDIANFNYFNGTLGHKLGDQLLIEISNRLKGITSDSKTVARLNGDEFCVVTSNITDTHDALVKADVIRKHVCEPIIIDDIRIDLECNLGLAIFPEHSKDGSDLIRLSNIALHNTKGLSTHISVYDAKYDKHDAKSLAIITGLQTAIDNDELHLEYQPKIDLDSGKLQGVEALIRWHHPVYKNVPPIEFIGWAEKSGLINHLTNWVLTTAEKQSAAWEKLGLKIPIAINLSPVNLEDEQIMARIKQTATNGYFKNGLLELELTENAVVKDAEKAFVKMRQLQSLGVTISIDDFGTGLASFGYLRNFPVNTLKIDRSFVDIQESDDHDVELLRSMIKLGHNLNCSITAEGVEKEETLDLLRSFGCDFAQGYHICRPTLAESIENWILTNKIQLLDRGAERLAESDKSRKAA